MRLQWRSGQQSKQGDPWRVFPSGRRRTCFLRGITICRKHGAVCAKSHTTVFLYSTLIFASSAAGGAAVGCFTCRSRQVDSPSATWWKKAFHIPPLRGTSTRPQPFNANGQPTHTYVRHRIDCPAPVAMLRRRFRDDRRTRSIGRHARQLVARADISKVVSLARSVKGVTGVKNNMRLK